MEDIQEEVESTVPEVWKFAKPQLVASQDPDDPAALEAAAAGPKMGQLIKFLNNIDDEEELEQRVQERDPSTNMTLLQWATLTGRFVLVEWLVKKAKRGAFAFVDEPLHEITVFDKWDEIRKEVAEREKEKAAALKENGGVALEEDEDAEPEPTADELAFEALADYHDEWGMRGKGLVKAIGELGVYQGARDEHGAKCGLGMSLYPQGDAYTGEYRDCMRDGKGTYHFASEGMVYTGDWKNNMRHGVGRMVYTDGGRYLGAWEFDKRSGEGRYTYPDGSSYAGEWQADVKHGKGTYSFVDGSRYSGRFYDGVFTSGEWLHGAGQRYVGSFGPDGAPFGKGVFHFPNGTRQSGEYRNGKWIPAQPFIMPTLEPTASIELALQNKKVPLGVSSDCTGFGEDVLARIANFAPLHEWATKIEAERGIFVQSITVASATLDATRTPTAVRIKVKAVDASGAVVKGLTEGFTLVAPEQRLVILLRSGGKTYAVVQQSVSLAAGGVSTVMFPQVRVTRQGGFASAFASAAVGALRLEQPTRSNTTALPPASHAAPRYTNARISACVYIQDVHVDTIATAAARLDAGAASLPPFERPRLMPLDEVAAASIDAMTVLLVHRLAGDFKDVAAAGATVEAQRPPTPIPPPMEPRPNIEPLLEAERQRKEDAEA